MKKIDKAYAYAPIKKAKKKQKCKQNRTMCRIYKSYRYLKMSDHLAPIYVRSKYLQLPPGAIKPSIVDTPSRQITWIAIYDQTLKHTY